LIHFFSTRRYMPDVSTIPDLSTPRSRLDRSDSSRTVGITPFMARNEGDKPTVSDGEVTMSWSEEKMSSEMVDPDVILSSPLGAYYSHESSQLSNPPR
jgi:hypothetical protein